MKYSFTSIDTDITELTYKDKRFEIHKDVDLMKCMQSIPIKARTAMMLDLSKKGLTKKDLVIERKEGNKTYYDNSNLLEVEEAYSNQASVDIIDELCQKYFNMGLAELITDIGLEDKDTEKFGTDLMSAFSGIKKDDFPRNQEEEI